jgi:hypothetical protein
MKLPALDHPPSYQGLYVYDFGAWSAVGYTAEEIAVLLEDQDYRGGKVYKIHRAHPNGQMELKGVSSDRFELESGLFFYRDELSTARADFRTLCESAEETALPCRAFVQLADRREESGSQRYVTALVYPAEYDDDVSQWLLDRNYAGGDTVEGGVSHVTDYYGESHEVIARRQLMSEAFRRSRPAAEVLASVRRAVQR